MTCAFDPMSYEERRRFAARYAVYLSRRHGNLDPSNGEIQYRKGFLEEVRARDIRWPTTEFLEQQPIESLLSENCEKYRNPVLWWTVSAVRWSDVVSQKMPLFGSESDVLPYVEAERDSHQLLMRELTLSLRIPSLPRAPAKTHWMTRGIFVQNRWMRAAIAHGVASAKVMVSTLFYDQSLRVFSMQPQFAERIRQVMQEMLVDESGYVHYLRSQLTDAQLTMARRVFTGTAEMWLSNMPELVTLVGKMRVKEEMSRARIFEIRQDMPRTSGVFRCVA